MHFVQKDFIMNNVIARTRTTTRINKIAKRLARTHQTKIILFRDEYGGTHLRTLDKGPNRAPKYWNFVETDKVNTRPNGWVKKTPSELRRNSEAPIVEVSE
jgi:hypothetical protein